METAYRSPDVLPDAIPPSILIGGVSVPIRRYDDYVLIADLPEGIATAQVPIILALVFGWTVQELKQLPGVYKVEVEVLAPDIDRLLEEQEKELESLRRIVEPQVELNPSDPQLEGLKPTGKLIWDSVFTKPAPVANLSQWANLDIADSYVYLPNDLSKPLGQQEEATSNSMYTEVLVNAYVRLCRQEGIKPKVQLSCGLVLPVDTLSPFQGTQHNVPGETASRLANSSLVNFDDRNYAVEFIACICDLDSWEYESEAVRRRVLSKVEHILMGRTSHTSNQRVIHALYNRFIYELEENDPWAADRVGIARCVMGVLKQMVTDGYVLADSTDIFIHKMTALGFGLFSQALTEVYNQYGGVRVE